MNVNVISFRQSEKISKVAETFVKLGISGAPVIDNYNNIVGIISERDIIELFKSKSSILGKTEDLLAETLQFFHIYPIASLKFRRTIRELNQEENFWKEIESRKIEDVMTAKPLTISEDESIEKVIELIVENGVNRVPVVNMERKLVGIVTRADIIDSIARDLGEK